MYSNINSECIGAEVITETGTNLGWLKQVKLDTGGQIHSLILMSAKPSFWPSNIRSSYELLTESIVYVNPTRIVVAEGSEEQVFNLKIGLLEKLGFVRLPWEQDEASLCTVSIQREDGDDDIGSPVRVPRPYSPNDGEDAVELPFT